jgi:hypothetical protein
MSNKTKTVVSNVFIYKKKDALRYTLSEYDDIKNLMLVFDIKDLPYIGRMESPSRRVRLAKGKSTL